MSIYSAFHIRDARSLSSLLNTLPVLVLVASSNHAGEKEQERSEQSVPVYPAWHVHTQVLEPAQEPCPLHTAVESVDGHLLTVPVFKNQK